VRRRLRIGLGAKDAMRRWVGKTSTIVLTILAALAIVTCAVSFPDYPEADEGSAATMAGDSSATGGGGAAGAAASTGPAASTGQGGGGGVDCAALGIANLCSLENDFDRGLFAPWRMDECASLLNNELLLVPPSGTNGKCSFSSDCAYPLSTSCLDGVFVEVREVTAAVEGTYTGISLYAGESWVGLLTGHHVVVDGGVVPGVYAGWYRTVPAPPEDAGMYYFQYLGVYDAVAERWWRIRHDGSKVHFETSPDGVSYSDHVTPKTPITTPFSINEPVKLELIASNSKRVSATGVARFDCLNVPPPCGQ